MIVRIVGLQLLRRVCSSISYSTKELMLPRLPDIYKVYFMRACVISMKEGVDEFWRVEEVQYHQLYQPPNSQGLGRNISFSRWGPVYGVGIAQPKILFVSCLW